MHPPQLVPTYLRFTIKELCNGCSDVPHYGIDNPSQNYTNYGLQQNKSFINTSKSINDTLTGHSEKAFKWLAGTILNQWG